MPRQMSYAAENKNGRPFFRMHHYVTPTARYREMLRITGHIYLANDMGLRPIVRVTADTRRAS